jgi:tagaturonate epimerase
MKTLTGFMYYPDSLEESDGVTYFLVRSEEENIKYLGVMTAIPGATGRLLAGFQDGQGIARDSGASTHLYPLTPENAAALRQRLPWLRPQPLGLCTTAGFGDRLGLATPGHVRAVENTGIHPIFAQQSVRENARTRRTPQQVIDDAMWGVLQTGWRQPWGADADHLKTPADIDSFFAAGFTFFTIDPGEHVDNAAQEDALRVLNEKVRALPWDRLDSRPDETLQRYLNQTYQIENFNLAFSEETLLRALAKYGRAIAHTAEMARHLAVRAGTQGIDLEISVDETYTPTSPEEHFLVASELRRLGVQWNSLAPRFTGRFEKGVDYIGDLAEFEAQFARHAAIARYFGNYRLSLHSGSDKFSIYAIAARQARGLLHLKTAGTSYLEALRVIALVNPELFRKILLLAVERYEEDRASYHVSAVLSKVNMAQDEQPGHAGLPDPELTALLDQFDARQVFHVTFGAVLDRFYTPLMETLRANENLYYEGLEAHFKKHLAPFIQNR